MARVASGPAEVLAAGVVTTWFGHGLEVVADVAGVALRVRFAFADDAVDPAPRVDTTPRDGGWDLRLVNLDEPGRGSAEPVLLGAIGADLVFLHFRVFRFGATADRTLHYTLHRVAKVDAGWQAPEDP